MGLAIDRLSPNRSDRLVNATVFALTRDLRTKPALTWQSPSPSSGDPDLLTRNEPQTNVG